MQVNEARAVDRVEANANEDKRHEILAWVYPTQHPQAEDALHDLLSRRQSGTGTWFLESSAFRGWVNGEESDLLWVTGLPGAGKSLLCATMIEHLQAVIKEPNQKVVFFICSFKDQEETTTKLFLMSLAAQLAATSSECLELATKSFGKKNGHPLRLDEYLALVQSFLHGLQRVFIIVDGLDEMGGANIKEKEIFVRMLSELLGPSGRPGHAAKKLLITSREDASIRSYLIGKVMSQVVDLNSDCGEMLKAELQTVVAAQLQESLCSDSGISDGGIVVEIQSHIIRTAVTLLHAKYLVDHIIQQRSDRDRIEAIQNMPSNLTDIYVEILSTALKKYPDREVEIKLTLQWLTVSVTPLTLSQLAEVVSVREDDTFLEFRGICRPHDVIAPISQLVKCSTDATHTRDEDATVQSVRLNHETVRHFLTGSDIGHTSVSRFLVTENEAHAFATRLCLQYIAFPDFAKEAPSSLKDLKALMSRYTFLEYAAMHWATHLRLSGLSTEEELGPVKPYLTWFTHPKTSPRTFRLWKIVRRVIFAQLFALKGVHWISDWVWNNVEGSYASSISPLKFAIEQDINVVVGMLLPSVANINDFLPDDTETCLTVAARANNATLIERLVAMGADIDKAEESKGLTPLHRAAEDGCEEAVAVLLRHGASVHAVSDSGSTPFYRAARGGSAKVLRMLYEAGSEVDAETYDGWTPLMEAVENARRDVVKLLLVWGADPLKKSSSYECMSAMQMARRLRQSHLAAVMAKALEERGVREVVDGDDTP
ncbi:putative ankyrin repeat protein [Colletotrichum trifolii]|uniref:Putative ankyrin repeat protein n=1 Tax=Colletotrichum trifolii TaxID=5466 RepID=A0A4R8QNR7_COLTR|nr:putative ankyrin repeat protein [Colletotrichum trifolii]